MSVVLRLLRLRMMLLIVAVMMSVDLILVVVFRLVLVRLFELQKVVAKLGYVRHGWKKRLRAKLTTNFHLKRSQEQENSADPFPRLPTQVMNPPSIACPNCL